MRRAPAPVPREHNLVGSIIVVACLLAVLVIALVLWQQTRVTDEEAAAVHRYDHNNWAESYEQISNRVAREMKAQSEEHAYNMQRIRDGTATPESIRREKDDARQRQMAEDLAAIRRELEKKK